MKVPRFRAHLWPESLHKDANKVFQSFGSVRSEPGRRVEHVAGTFGPCGAKRPLGGVRPATNIYIYINKMFYQSTQPKKKHI